MWERECESVGIHLAGDENRACTLHASREPLDGTAIPALGAGPHSHRLDAELERLHQVHFVHAGDAGDGDDGHLRSVTRLDAVTEFLARDCILIADVLDTVGTGAGQQRHHTAPARHRARSAGSK